MAIPPNDATPPVGPVMPEDRDQSAPHEHDSMRDELPENLWMRGLYMLILALFFAIAETLLVAVALVQFFWMVFAGEKNAALADFGKQIGNWLARVAEFQSGATEEKPFPWARWE